MALYIRSEEVDQLARTLSRVTGEGLTEAVGKALGERLDRVQRQAAAGGPSPSERERRELGIRRLMKARELCLADGCRLPTKEEIEEMTGMDY